MRRAGAVAGALLALVLAGCGGDAGSDRARSDGAGSGGAGSDEAAPPPSGATSSGGRVSGTVDVFAAASLTDAFGDIAELFEQRHPDVTVTLNLGGSSALAEQINAGAPADVFAAASPRTMQTVVDAGGARDPAVFARNALQIAVPKGNPGDVTGLPDFADAGRTIALCAAQVPCGAAAEEVFAAAGVTPAPDTLEQDVRAALAKVRLGEVDAALVYRTDVLAAGDEVTGVPFPEAEGAVSDYPVVVLEEAPDAEAAQAFVALVLGPEGQGVLADAGFVLP